MNKLEPQMNMDKYRLGVIEKLLGRAGIKIDKIVLEIEGDEA